MVYVHGATFPSALSVAYPFDGRSWASELSAAGLDVWALDFAGFGMSERYAMQDFAAWSGDLAYDPAQIQAPTLIVRGEWDSLCTDDDAAGLSAALTRAPLRRDVKISKGTHLMHFESSRFDLYRETATFLLTPDASQ